MGQLADHAKRIGQLEAEVAEQKKFINKLKALIPASDLEDAAASLEDTTDADNLDQDAITEDLLSKEVPVVDPPNGTPPPVVEDVLGNGGEPSTDTSTQETSTETKEEENTDASNG